MSYVRLKHPGFRHPGYSFRRGNPVDATPDVSDLQRGFTLASSPMVSPVSGTSSALMVQELHPVDIGGGNYRWFWGSWASTGAAPPGAIWTATSNISNVTSLSNIQEILTSADASTATSGGLDYLRVSFAEYHSGTYRLFLSGGNGCYLATSTNGTTLTLNTTPVLTQLGEGYENTDVVTQLAAYRTAGGKLLGIYSQHGGWSDAQYLRATSDDNGATWTKLGADAVLTPTGPFSGAIEFHALLRYGNRLVMSFEGYNGAGKWAAFVAYSPVIVDEDEEAAYLGSWSYYSEPVAQRNVSSSWHQVHVATPVIKKIGVDTYVFVQGSNTSGDGYGGPWYLGYGILNPE